jgi:hypothetical protein
VTLERLQYIAKYINAVYVKRDEQPVLVADLYRVYHPDRPNEWWVCEYPSQLVKRIGEY